jgi:hypothetical protein
VRRRESLPDGSFCADRNPLLPAIDLELTRSPTACCGLVPCPADVHICRHDSYCAVRNPFLTALARHRRGRPPCLPLSPKRTATLQRHSRPASKCGVNFGGNPNRRRGTLHVPAGTRSVPQLCPEQPSVISSLLGGNGDNAHFLLTPLSLWSLLSTALRQLNIGMAVGLTHVRAAVDITPIVPQRLLCTV